MSQSPGPYLKSQQSIFSPFLTLKLDSQIIFSAHYPTVSYVHIHDPSKLGPCYCFQMSLLPVSSIFCFTIMSQQYGTTCGFLPCVFLSCSHLLEHYLLEYFLGYFHLNSVLLRTSLTTFHPKRRSWVFFLSSLLASYGDLNHNC